MGQSRFRPSPELVIALLALFFALGGIGYAAATIGTSDIKNGAVTEAKLHDNSVTSVKISASQVQSTDIAGQAVNGSKVENGSLLGADLAPGVLPRRATSFDTVVPASSTVTLKSVDGLDAAGTCNPGGNDTLSLKPTGLTSTADLSGTESGGSTLLPVNQEGGNGASVLSALPLDMDVIARNSAVASNFARFELHLGSPSGPSNGCQAWGVIAPSG
jgi:hypothetical protein